MSQTSSGAAGAGMRNFAVALALSGYLIATFFWRVFVPAHEYPLRNEQLLEIGLDALCVIGLVGVRKALPAPLFWTALIAGLTLFAIRMTGDAAWWTGHLSFSIPPR